LIRRLIAFCVALAAMGAAAGVLVVAAAYALFALVRDYVGPAGAAAIDCLCAAVLLAVLGFIAYRQVKAPGRPKPKHRDGEAERGGGLADKLADTLRERPMVAASAAAAAGLLAWRNPVLVSTVLRLLDPGAAAKRRKP
jgi:hypothetical protein